MTTTQTTQQTDPVKPMDTLGGIPSQVVVVAGLMIASIVLWQSLKIIVPIFWKKSLDDPLAELAEAIKGLDQIYVRREEFLAVKEDLIEIKRSVAHQANIEKHLAVIQNKLTEQDSAINRWESERANLSRLLQEDRKMLAASDKEQNERVQSQMTFLQNLVERSMCGYNPNNPTRRD